MSKEYRIREEKYSDRPDEYSVQTRDGEDDSSDWAIVSCFTYNTIDKAKKVIQDLITRDEVVRLSWLNYEAEEKVRKSALTETNYINID